ncbi:MAG: extracellular solute-binding protein [Chloroflexota bacterium]|nr:extracellular solute-binding protein [Chloroflexota bacterium]
MDHRNLSRRDALKLAAATGGALAGSVLPEALAPLGTAAQEAGPTAVPVPSGDVLEGFVPLLTDEPITLEYWSGNQYEPSIELIDQVIERFSVAYPQVTVNAVSGQNCDAFVTAAAAGTPPDLFHTWDCVQRMGNFAERGLIIPLDAYIEQTDFDLDDYGSNIMDTCRMAGQTWGMVDTAGLYLLWTRPPILAEAGIPPDALPADTDELWAWAEAATVRDANGAIERLGFSPPRGTWEWYSWIASYGGVLWDDETGQPTPDHPGVIAALNDVVAQVNNYGADNLTRWTASMEAQAGAPSPYLTGGLAMMLDGDWTGQTITDSELPWTFGEDYNAGAVPPPPADKLQGESRIAFWSWPWVIPAGTANPDWSWELLRYVLSPEYQINVHARLQEIVVRRSLLGDERLSYPTVTIADDIINGSRPLTTVMPMIPVAAEYTNLLNEAFERVSSLAETPEQAMALVKEDTLAEMS